MPVPNSIIDILVYMLLIAHYFPYWSIGHFNGIIDQYVKQK